LKTFEEFAELHPSYTLHLLGYGLLKKERGNYDFNIDSIKEYVLEQGKYRRIGLTNTEMWSEISLRRNSSEVKLRKVIKILLKANLGVVDAKQVVLDIFGGQRKSKLSPLTYDELFNAAKSEIYFSDLAKIISKKWDFFKHSFEQTKQDTFRQLDFINSSRADAHAKELSAEEFAYFRLCMASIEKDLDGLM
jgi:hypothetical protein